MSKKFHAAPGPSAGYGYQFERALYWLARSPAGAVVGIETEDDVAIRSGAVSLLEQDKHSIVDGTEPFGDRSRDLWNTLCIWLDAVEESRVDPETTRFLMVTNKVLRECLAKAIGGDRLGRRCWRLHCGLGTCRRRPAQKDRVARWPCVAFGVASPSGNCSRWLRSHLPSKSTWILFSVDRT